MSEEERERAKDTHAMAICNACNAQFPDEQARRSHYRSEWHQYNLRRKVMIVSLVVPANCPAADRYQSRENRVESIDLVNAK
jgi:hypothetical protein